VGLHQLHVATWPCQVMLQRFFMGLLGAASLKPSIVFSNDESGLDRLAAAAGTITRQEARRIQAASADRPLTVSYTNASGRICTEGTKYLKTSELPP
jgi:hypothetical protein